jgi:hypothetical protein
VRLTGGPFADPLPAGVFDFSSEVPPYGDRFTPHVSVDGNAKRELTRRTTKRACSLPRTIMPPRWACQTARASVSPKTGFTSTSSLTSCWYRWSRAVQQCSYATLPPDQSARMTQERLTRVL